MGSFRHWALGRTLGHRMSGHSADLVGRQDSTSSVLAIQRGRCPRYNVVTFVRALSLGLEAPTCEPRHPVVFSKSTRPHRCGAHSGTSDLETSPPMSCKAAVVACAFIKAGIYKHPRLAVDLMEHRTHIFQEIPLVTSISHTADSQGLVGHEALKACEVWRQVVEFQTLSPIVTCRNHHKVRLLTDADSLN